ncbi:Aldolase-type TIM barrel [Penicillium italicum]|uniref:Aldolase-type TIM barrel n=1 Tax=Penicillium italicum TaxID=40296 RepID=A0A0A2KI48_PENIT|nr:Aldolase-type TIM barrel [Penicillium italicum]
MIAYDQLESPGNMIIDLENPFVGERFEAFKQLAIAAKKHGSLIVGQVSHPGRQTIEQLQPSPVSASDVQLVIEKFGAFGKPHAATEEEIQDIIRRFVHVSVYLQKAGYDGIQLHSAHDYLLAQLLSQTTNKRTDKYALPDPGFIIGININSVEFQAHGFTPEESKELCEILDRTNFDFVELSGGTYEAGAFQHKRESSQKRESFFLEFADLIAPALKRTRSYVTGGFCTASGMGQALETVDGIGLGRSITQEPRLPKELLAGTVQGATQQKIDPQDFFKTSPAAGVRLLQIAKDEEPIDLSNDANMEVFMNGLGEWAQQMQKDGAAMNMYGYAQLPKVALASWPFFDTAKEISESPYRNDQPKVKVETLFQFPNNGSWIDNMVVRSDGNLLFTRLDTPEVWLFNTTSGNATLAYSFPNVTSCFGISEIDDDVFAVVVGNFSAKTFQPGLGSFSVHKLDFTKVHAKENERVLESPKASEIVAMPDAEALNGMATFSRESNLVLIADSPKGIIWKVDTQTGNYSVALNDTTMAPAEGVALPLGVNSLTVFGDYVYYTGTTRMVYCRVKVDSNVTPIGDFEVIASGFLPDNIEMTEDGTAYIATAPQNSVVRLTPSGQISLVTGGQVSTRLAGASSVRFSKDRQILYVGTNGGQIAPVLGSFIEPAKIVKISFE